jgi:hypothetical protein
LAARFYNSNPVWYATPDVTSHRFLAVLCALRNHPLFGLATSSVSITSDTTITRTALAAVPGDITQLARKTHQGGVFAVGHITMIHALRADEWLLVCGAQTRSGTLFQL